MELFTNSQIKTPPIPPPPPIMQPEFQSQQPPQIQYQIPYNKQQPISTTQPPQKKKDKEKTKFFKNFLTVSIIINLVLMGLLFIFAEDDLFGTDVDSLESKYSEEEEVLNRDRVIFREYDIVMDWKGHSMQFYPNWNYTIDWKLSFYIESLRRDHSINYFDGNSIKKFVDCLDETSFYLQNLHDSFPNKADLANAILDIVHALEYKNDPPGIEDVRYPDETLIEGCGDCEDLVILCATMFEGNGLDAVFIAWREHAQAGVYLEEPPKMNFGTPWYVTYNNKDYYICECTDDYRWDVGDMPPEIQNQIPVAIYDV